MNRFIGHQIHLSGIAMNYFVNGFHFCNLLYPKSVVYVNWLLSLTFSFILLRRNTPLLKVDQALINIFHY